MIIPKFENVSHGDVTTICNPIYLTLDIEVGTTKKEKKTIDINDIIKTKSNKSYTLPQRSTQRSTPKPSLNDSTTIKISNIPLDVDDNALRELVEIYGSVRRINIPKARKTQTMLGYCFITFYERRDAEKALEKLHKSTYNYCIIHVNWAT